MSWAEGFRDAAVAVSVAWVVVAFIKNVSRW